MDDKLDAVGYVDAASDTLRKVDDFFGAWLFPYVFVFLNERVGSITGIVRFGGQWLY